MPAEDHDTDTIDKEEVPDDPLAGLFVSLFGKPNDIFDKNGCSNGIYDNDESGSGDCNGEVPIDEEGDWKGEGCSTFGASDCSCLDLCGPPHL